MDFGILLTFSNPQYRIPVTHLFETQLAQAVLAEELGYDHVWTAGHHGTDMYFPAQFPVLAADGRVNDFMFEARERGIFFDLGHGAGSFWFRQAAPAVKGGFPPDTLSTDLHMANINGPVISMLNTMNKFLAIGMPLGELIQRSTCLPAELIDERISLCTG